MIDFIACDHHVPITLDHLQYGFGNIEESHPLILNDGSNRQDHDFIKFAFDFFSEGFEPTVELVSDLLDVWLLQQHFLMQYSPGDAAVLAGNVKAYDRIPGGNEFVADMEWFKTEMVIAGPTAKGQLLSWLLDRVKQALADKAVAA